MKRRLTLPTDSTVRKSFQLVAGLDGYFPAALAGVAQHSYKSNEKHNKGQPLHWSMDKSNDHAECVRRHLLDLCELLATFERPGEFIQGDVQDAPTVEDVLDEANALAWRALALSQTLHMALAGAPRPFNARRTSAGPGVLERGGMDPYDDRLPPHMEGYPSPRCVICKQQGCSGCGVRPENFGPGSDGY